MGLTPGTWYVDTVRGGFIIRAAEDSERKVVRGAGGFARHADALACAYVPELIAAAQRLLEAAERWHASDDGHHRRLMPSCPDCAAMVEMRCLLDALATNGSTVDAVTE